MYSHARILKIYPRCCEGYEVKKFIEQIYSKCILKYFQGFSQEQRLKIPMGAKFS